MLTHGLDEVSPDNPEEKIGLKRQGYTFNITISKNKLPTVYGTVSAKAKVEGEEFYFILQFLKNSKL